MTGENTKGTVSDTQDSVEANADATPPPESARRRTLSERTEEGQQVQEMLAEGAAVMDPDAAEFDEFESLDPESSVERPRRKIAGWIEDFSHKWGARHLKVLVQKKGRLSRSMLSVPENMHRVANQSRLVLELIDDFRYGTYREIPWRSVALLVGGVLYTVSPADVIPDVLPFVGQLDDLVLIALATRFVQADLRKYCQFKGYEESDYFAPRRK